MRLREATPYASEFGVTVSFGLSARVAKRPFTSPASECAGTRNHTAL
jgi:hypothetical protein